MRRKLSVCLVTTLALIALPSGAATDSLALGQVASSGALLDGIPVPTGTTVLSPAVVESGADPVLLHLLNGQVIVLDRQSTTRLERTEAGAIALAVETGAASLQHGSGEVMTLATNSLLVLDQEGQVRAGAPVSEAVSEEMARLCQLLEATPERFAECTASKKAARDCAWQLLEVPPGEVGSYLDVSAVWAGTDRNDLGLDDDCREEAGAGLTTAKKAGIAVGAAVLAGFAYDEIDDDDGDTDTDDESPDM